MSVIRTDWFPGDQKPRSVGVYERGNDSIVVYSKWDGAQWLVFKPTPEVAAKQTERSEYQYMPWRGVVPEVLGCIPVEADAEDTCRGCYFLNNCECAAAWGAVNCSEESIIWRPRAEVQA